MLRAAFTAALLPLAACAPAVEDTPPPPEQATLAGQCDPAPAQALVGQTASAESGSRAIALTGATRLRWGPPRTAFTMDYSPGRVNVIYDDAMTITQVTCG